VKNHKLQYLILGADELWTIIAMVLAFVMRFGLTWHDSLGNSPSPYLPALLISLGLWVVLFSPMQLDGFSKGWHPPAIVSQLFLATCLLMMALFAAGYVARIFVSRLVFAYFGILLFIGFVGIRHLARAVLGSKYMAKAVHRVLIVGNGPVAREIAAKIERHPELLCRVVGFLCSADTSASDVPGAMHSPAIVPTLGIIDLLRTQKVDEVIIALSKPGTPEVMNLAQSCRRAGIGVSVVPHPYEFVLVEAAAIGYWRTSHTATPAGRVGSLERGLEEGVGCRVKRKPFGPLGACRHSRGCHSVAEKGGLLLPGIALWTRRQVVSYVALEFGSGGAAIVFLGDHFAAAQHYRTASTVECSAG